MHRRPRATRVYEVSGPEEAADMAVEMCLRFIRRARLPLRKRHLSAIESAIREAFAKAEGRWEAEQACRDRTGMPADLARVVGEVGRVNRG